MSNLKHRERFASRCQTWRVPIHSLASCWCCYTAPCSTDQDGWRGGQTRTREYNPGFCWVSCFPSWSSMRSSVVFQVVPRRGNGRPGSNGFTRVSGIVSRTAACSSRDAVLRVLHVSESPRQLRGSLHLVSTTCSTVWLLLRSRGMMFGRARSCHGLGNGLGRLQLRRRPKLCTASLDGHVHDFLDRLDMRDG